MIEIYGISGNGLFCWNCEYIKKVANENDLVYDFINVVEYKSSSDIKFIDFVNQISKDVGKQPMEIGYPQIYINKKYFGNGNKFLRNINWIKENIM